MSDPDHQLEPPRPVRLARPGRYILPDDLEFECLVPCPSEGIIRIRFSRARGTKLDLPLSERALADLARTLFSLHGFLPDKIFEGLEEFRKVGGPVLDG
jgi:hypothetical protein